MDDYTALVTSALGIDAATLGAYLLTLVSISSVAGLVAPYLQSRLPEWQEDARATATLADDRAVRVLGTVLQVALVVVSVTAWIVPRFAVGIRAGRDAKLLESRR